ncbi:MAG: hypothetical protein AAF799_00685 [Myxococcota bacterium]
MVLLVGGMVWSIHDTAEQISENVELPLKSESPGAGDPCGSQALPEHEYGAVAKVEAGSTGSIAVGDGRFVLEVDKPLPIPVVLALTEVQGDVQGAFASHGQVEGVDVLLLNGYWPQVSGPSGECRPNPVEIREPFDRPRLSMSAVKADSPCGIRARRMVVEEHQSRHFDPPGGVGPEGAFAYVSESAQYYCLEGPLNLTDSSIRAPLARGLDTLSLAVEEVFRDSKIKPKDPPLFALVFVFVSVCFLILALVAGWILVGHFLNFVKGLIDGSDQVPRYTGNETEYFLAKLMLWGWKKTKKTFLRRWWRYFVVQGRRLGSGDSGKKIEREVERVCSGPHVALFGLRLYSDFLVFATGRREEWVIVSRADVRWHRVRKRRWFEGMFGIAFLVLFLVGLPWSEGWTFLSLLMLVGLFAVLVMIWRSCWVYDFQLHLEGQQQLGLVVPPADYVVLRRWLSGVDVQSLMPPPSNGGDQEPATVGDKPTGPIQPDEPTSGSYQVDLSVPNPAATDENQIPGDIAGAHDEPRPEKSFVRSSDVGSRVEGPDTEHEHEHRERVTKEHSVEGEGGHQRVAQRNDAEREQIAEVLPLAIPDSPLEGSAVVSGGFTVRSAARVGHIDLLMLASIGEIDREEGESW